jgi:hypothetical protein
LFGDRRYDRSTVTVADQDHPVQVSATQDSNDVGDMRIQPYLRTQQMRTLTEAGQRRGDYCVATGLELGRDVTPTPAAEPCARDE